MKKILTVLSVILGTIIFFNLNSCKEDNGVTKPEEIQVNMTGKINPPFETSKIIGMKVSFGQEEYIPDSKGEFTFIGNPSVPGMAIVTDDNNNPYLMSLIPKPIEDNEILVDVHSTALSMVFLNPFICSSNPDDAEKIVADLEQLDEFIQFEEVLELKLSDNALALLDEDEDLELALNYVILAYINLITANGSGFSLKKRSEKKEDIIIEPVSMVSGHNLEHTGENNFTIYNYYGRWAKCIIPGDDIFLPPNGDLVDVLKWSPLWEASKRSFGMEIIAGKDAKEVNVYGLGFALEESPTWEQLSAEEQNHVLYAGMITVVIEFVPRIISVVTNTSATFGKGQIASNRAMKILGTVFAHTKIVEKARRYISDGDYSGFYWEMAKEHISLLVNDDEFQEKFITEMGIVLTESGIKTLACWVVIPLKVLFLADDLTGLAKSALALHNAQLKTTFKIYSEDFKYGNVNGNVYDEETSLAIQGVNVTLLGDENNPMNPNYNYTTDASGGFWFENILTGKKTISVSKQEYGEKTVEIEVKDKETTPVVITLSKEKGSVTGKVVNEIYLKNGVTPINFKKECHLDIKEIGGNSQSYSFWIYEQDNGSYTKSLTPGMYEIKAWHEDYEEAVTTITVTGKILTTAEDLILKPKCTMEGYIYIKSDPLNSSSYDIQREFKTNKFVGAGLQFDENCGIAGKTILTIGGFVGDINGSSIQNFDEIQIALKPGISAGNYSLGDWYEINCSSSFDVGVSFNTDRPSCYSEDSDVNWLDFRVYEDVDEATCNCGITNFGSIYIDEIGNELTDVIKGKIVCDLAGSEVCFCNYNDHDNDGEPEWLLDCITARLDIDFKVLRGTLYKAGSE
jgi:hypothetical protein